MRWRRKSLNNTEQYLQSRKDLYLFLRDGEFAPTDGGLKRMWINKIILTDI